MNAGLPGIGISGVFYIVSALLMPLTQIVRVMRGRRRARSWLMVLGHFSIGVAMIAAMYGTGRLLTFVLHATGHEVADGRIWWGVLLSLVPFVVVLAVIQLATLVRRPR